MTPTGHKGARDGILEERGRPEGLSWQQHTVSSEARRGSPIAWWSAMGLSSRTLLTWEHPPVGSHLWARARGAGALVSVRVLASWEALRGLARVCQRPRGGFAQYFEVGNFGFERDVDR